MANPFAVYSVNIGNMIARRDQDWLSGTPNLRTEEDKVTEKSFKSNDERSDKS